MRTRFLCECRFVHHFPHVPKNSEVKCFCFQPVVLTSSCNIPLRRYFLSQLSAFVGDVEEVLTAAKPDAIVLELCESRLASLRKMIRHSSPDKRLSTTVVKGRSKRTFAQISRTFKGIPQALLAVFLDTAYKLQIISGLDPGIEFLHPIRDYPPSRVFCGDAPASETIHRLYRVFVTPLQSIRRSLDAIQSLFARVFQPPHGGVNFPAVLLLDLRRLRELAQLTLSAVLVGLGLVFLGNAASMAFETAAVTSQVSQASPVPLSTFTFWGLMHNVAQFLFMSYVIVSSINFFKVLILDRDAIIADRIVETTWRQAVTLRRPITVCAVVGLLHVNGILQQLQDIKHDE